MLIFKNSYLEINQSYTWVSWLKSTFQINVLLEKKIFVPLKYVIASLLNVWVANLQNQSYLKENHYWCLCSNIESYKICFYISNYLLSKNLNLQKFWVRYNKLPNIFTGQNKTISQTNAPFNKKKLKKLFNKERTRACLRPNVKLCEIANRMLCNMHDTTDKRACIRHRRLIICSLKCMYNNNNNNLKY